MSAQAAKTIERPATRAHFAARLAKEWRRGRNVILAVGNTLIEAKRSLSAEDFAALIENDLPFGVDQARRLMRISADPRLHGRETSHIVPDTVDAMDTLGRLTDPQFEHAIGSGAIHKEMTVREARELVATYQRSPVSLAVDNVKLHRPNAWRCGPPKEPVGGVARTWPEIVWTLARRRESLSLSQLQFDDRCKWTAGQTSKYEIPHADDGRMPGADALCEWLEGLDYGVAFVPLNTTVAP